MKKDVIQLLDLIDGATKALEDAKGDIVASAEKLEAGTKSHSTKVRKICQEIKKAVSDVKKNKLPAIVQKANAVRALAQEKRDKLEASK